MHHRMRLTALVETHAAFAELLQVLSLAVGARPAPGCLNGSAQRSGFRVVGADHRGVHDVGHDLPPHGTFGATADQTDLFAFDTAVAQQVQPVAKAEGSAFDHRTRQVGLGQIGAVQPDDAAGRIGQGGHAFAVQKGQHQYAFGTDRRLGDCLVEAGDVEGEQLANGGRRVGQVHRADQRQPAAGG